MGLIIGMKVLGNFPLQVYSSFKHLLFISADYYVIIIHSWFSIHHHRTLNLFSQINRLRPQSYYNNIKGECSIFAEDAWLLPVDNAI